MPNASPAVAPRKVIIDFDNTFSIPGCDVDDGLALLFVLGNPELATVVGATATYGNNLIDTVHMNTRLMFDELGLDVPVFRGGPDAAHPESEAAEFLARRVAEEPGEVSVLATGALTNLRGAAIVDPGFFGRVCDVALMGGITQTLVFNGRIMNELNFSCDPIATKAVLSSGARVSTATGNNCLKAYFSAESFERRFGPGAAGGEGDYLWRKCSYWFRDMRERYGLDGFHCWDVVAAAYLLMPELFDDDVRDVTMSEAAFSIGYLEPAFQGAPQAPVNMPIIRDEAEFIEAVYSSWERALELLGV